MYSLNRVQPAGVTNRPVTPCIILSKSINKKNCGSTHDIHLSRRSVIQATPDTACILDSYIKINRPFSTKIRSLSLILDLSSLSLSSPLGIVALIIKIPAWKSTFCEFAVKFPSCCHRKVPSQFCVNNPNGPWISLLNSQISLPGTSLCYCRGSSIWSSKFNMSASGFNFALRVRSGIAEV